MEKTAVYQYKVPESIFFELRESQVNVVEILDSILFEAMGVHFLEPKVTFEMKYNVKQAISKQMQLGADPFSFVNSPAKKPSFVQMLPKEQNRTIIVPTDKRREALEGAFPRQPRLNLAPKIRPRRQEVAEV